MYSHVLIATDGSIIAQKGVEHGLQLAKSVGSKATVVIVTKPYPLQATTVTGWVAGDNDIRRYDASQKEFADTVLAAAKQTADKIGIAPELVQVTADSAADAIVEQGQELGCDLIVMASHGRRGVGRLLLGSQTAKVVQYAKTPVLVVR
ncbi:universal stress protein [Aminobacter sp. AP02]|uniref:universal stress protein n=1 Tax=Aminobacter sp. AP02 TaxID=2135737 RepID=UPI000D6AC806|nr:universal stress protein [Aminobacter sp. AP02]PWK72711.1 nucleotide-binding universal stress UspA family protein [Aminobacter sp. AP02]